MKSRDFAGVQHALPLDGDIYQLELTEPTSGLFSATVFKATLFRQMAPVSRPPRSDARIGNSVRRRRLLLLLNLGRSEEAANRGLFCFDRLCWKAAR